MQKQFNNRLLTLSFLGLLALAITPLIAGCAPNRADDDDDGPGGNTLGYALFTVVDYGDFNTSQQGRLVLVDAATTCENLDWGGGLRWWQLPTAVDWVELYLTRGIELEDWTRTYESTYSWQQEGSFDYPTAAFFSGSIGTGGNDGDDDDDDDVPVDPPPPIGRDVTGQIGNDAAAANDSLAISSYSLDGNVTGYLQSTAGNFSFSAEHCGIVYDEIVGGSEVPDTPPTDG